MESKMSKAERIGLLQIEILIANLKIETKEISILEFNKLELEIKLKQLKIFQEEGE